MQKVFALYRVSTQKQGTEKEIPFQKQQCMAFARKKEWEITEEITEKISGFNIAMLQRESIVKIIEGANNREFDILLVYMSDRLGRRIEYSFLISALNEKGIKVWSVTEGELKGDETDVDKSTVYMYLFNESESLKMSKRVKDSMAQLNEEGYYQGGNLPFGYKLVDTGEKKNSKRNKTVQQMLVDIEEAEIVKLIFDLADVENFGASKITQHLNKNGFTNRKKIWRHNTITRMLRNPTYMGYKRYNTSERKDDSLRKRKELSRDNWKLQPYNEELAIVSKGIFERVQEKLDRRQRSKQENNHSLKDMLLFSEIAICGYCKHKMKADYSLKSHTKKDGNISKYKVYRYTCHYSKNLGELHEGKRYFGARNVEKWVEEKVLKEIEKMEPTLVNHKVRESSHMLMEKSKGLKSLEKDYTILDEEYKNLEMNFTKEIFTDSMSNVEKLKEISLQKIELLEKIMHLRKEMDELESNLTENDKRFLLLDDWIEKYKAAENLIDKKNLLQQVIHKIELSSESINIIFQPILGKIWNQALNQVKKLYTDNGA